MRGATCFTGIGAPEKSMPCVDWVWHAEIEPFPAAVMAHHHPNEVNLGNVLADDFLERASSFGPIDILVGGPPCQSFSVAGLRQSLNDERGNLSLRWVEIVNAVRPRVAVTENVPGWLNTPDNAFGCFLAAVVGADDAMHPVGDAGWPGAGMVAGPRARLAWRVLDAQYFGVAQRRRRVFVVSSADPGVDPAAILFEPRGLRRHPPSRGEAREEVAGCLSARTQGGGGLGTDFELGGGVIAETRGRDPVMSEMLPEVAWCLQERNAKGADSDTKPGHLIPELTHALRSEGFDASEDGTGRGTPIVPIAFPARMSATAHASTENLSPALGATNPTAVATAWAVRRLTPTECERLQGFPDDFTNITWRGKPAPDGPRYKALGNSMAVPCIGWILRRCVDAMA